MKAAGDSGLKARFVAYWIDQPGNIANAGDTALGHYTVLDILSDANGDDGRGFAEDFKAKTGQYPLNVQGHVVHGMWGLGEALKALKAKRRRQAQCQALAFAMEKVSGRDLDGRDQDACRGPSGRCCRLRLPSCSKDAKFKADNTDKGFKTDQDC